jgi:hypothetical protein
MRVLFVACARLSEEELAEEGAEKGDEHGLSPGLDDLVEIPGVPPRSLETSPALSSASAASSVRAVSQATRSTALRVPITSFKASSLRWLLSPLSEQVLKYRAPR